jgi:hypothetical protein
MVDFHAALGEDFLKVAISYAVADVEEDREQDHALGDMSAFERNGHRTSPEHRKSTMHQYLHIRS